MKKKIKRIYNFLQQIDYLFSLNNFEKKVAEADKDEGGKMAEFHFEENYQRCTLIIFPRFFEESLEEQRKCLLHELCHSITIPSKSGMCELAEGKLVTPQQVDEINEKETSIIENILDRLLRDKLEYAKKAYGDYLK
jgi:hypothetical protein